MKFLFHLLSIPMEHTLIGETIFYCYGASLIPALITLMLSPGREDYHPTKRELDKEVLLKMVLYKKMVDDHISSLPFLREKLIQYADFS